MKLNLFSVLELSKWLMYNFHYNYIKKKIDANLLFLDTESLQTNRKMFMKNFLNIYTCLTLVNFKQFF